MPSKDLDLRIEQMLAAATGGARTPWPADLSSPEGEDAVIGEILYHGISGLLIRDASKLDDWPDAIVSAVHEQARGQAMWEMRHRIVVADMMKELADDDVEALILKGTSLAYDLYEEPACRARGDSDILIRDADLARARAVLERSGFHRRLADERSHHELDLQEMWRLDCADGTRHDIDLHWRAMNAPALEGVLPFKQCIANARRLPKLGEHALTLDRAMMLLHCCVHRAKHITSPYFASGITYYGGDRLIWAVDIDLLADAFSEHDWERFCELAREQGVSRVCLDGIQFAQARLGTAIPPSVAARLASGSEPGHAETYLLDSRQLTKAWHDLRAVSGFRQKLSYFSARALPSDEFMRAKYPTMKQMPLVVLYARRFAELLLRRPRRSRQ